VRKREMTLSRGKLEEGEENRLCGTPKRKKKSSKREVGRLCDRNVPLDRRCWGNREGEGTFATQSRKISGRQSRGRIEEDRC